MFKSLLDPVTQKLADTVQALSQTVQVLRKEGEEKETRIHALEWEVVQLKLAVDNHEQHGRRDSIRIFGLSEQTPALGATARSYRRQDGADAAARFEKF